MGLLSRNDLAQLQRAMEDGLEVCLTRTLGDITVTASTSQAPPIWECPMLVRLEIYRRNVYSSQYFSSIGDLTRHEPNL